MGAEHLREDDLRFVASLDEVLARAQVRAEPWLACRVGCTTCCLGPFAINALDAFRLDRSEDRLLDQLEAEGQAVSRERLGKAAGRFEENAGCTL